MDGRTADNGVIFPVRVGGGATEGEGARREEFPS